MELMPPSSPRDRPVLDFGFDRFVRSARSARVGAALLTAGWVHLVVFAACEFLYLRGDRAAAHFLPLWFFDMGLVAAILLPRLAATASHDAVISSRVMIRIGITFAILCLTSASLNSITGFAIDWFKISWALLGTFAFAMLAWIFHLAFLIPAVQMSLTALLIASHPDHAYAIFGVSWFATLQVLGGMLEFGPLLRRVTRRDCVVLRRTSPEA